jgi:LPXTG-motif cell wall-anchored protein
MDNTTIIRTLAGTLFFIVLAFLILRRRKKLN